MPPAPGRTRRVWCHRCGQLEHVVLGLVALHPRRGGLLPCPGGLDPVGDCPVCGRAVVVFVGAILPHPRHGPECPGTGRKPLRGPAPRAERPGAHQPEGARCPACGLDGIPVSGGRLAAHGWHRGQRLDGPLDPDGNPAPGEWVGGCSNREP